MREKQIEEMAKIITKNSYLCKGDYIRTTGKHNRDHCEDCDLRKACLSYDSASEVYDAGYRKQSENTIELPCKVGDKVYVLSQKSIQEYTVHAIEFNENTTTIKCHSWLAERESLLHKHIAYFNKTDFDKIVFLTKEEAEAKMKGGAE